MHIKILMGYNFSHYYLLYKEEEDLYYLINREGEVEQVKKTKFPLDKIIEVPATEAYKVVDDTQLYYEQLEYLLKWRCQEEKVQLDKLLGVTLQQHHNSHACFLDPDHDLRVVIYYAHFFKEIGRGEFEILEQHMQFLQEGSKEIVVFVMEEFGNLYMNGVHLRNYLENCHKEKRHGKKWELVVDYENLVRVRGESPFCDYSNDPNYVKHFRSSQESGHDAHALKNVVDLHALKQSQEIFRRIKSTRTGFRVVEVKKKAN